MRVTSVPQKQRCGPNASMIRRVEQELADLVAYLASRRGS
jgi:hypothetical protein